MRLLSWVALSLLAMSCLLMTGCVGSHVGGPMQAHKDVAKGHLELRSSGIAYPPRIYSRFLYDKLGVKVHIYRGKLPKDPNKSIYGYNDVVIRALEKKFGKGVMQKMDEEFNYVTNRDYIPMPKGMKRLQMSSYFLPIDRPNTMPIFSEAK
ncbi:hypothetical protein JD969_10400 [Planctomycetota bacterium]|nr:hypothetical protein JD969_10400 [Planctomycetota bacterium]